MTKVIDCFTFRCRKWVQNCRRDDLLGKSAEQLHTSGYLLCSEHFEPNQFNVPSERRRLVWNAVPTLFTVPNPPPRLMPSRPAPKERPASCHPRKRRRNDSVHGQCVLFVFYLLFIIHYYFNLFGFRKSCSKVIV